MDNVKILEKNPLSLYFPVPCNPEGLLKLKGIEKG